jgi:phosphoribosylformylglycinamidine (FGAM) synthase-like enzyme
MPEYLKFSEMTDEEVKKVLKENKIGLTVPEARKIETDILKRPPTLTEAVVWGIQGSEHLTEVPNLF